MNQLDRCPWCGSPAKGVYEPYEGKSMAQIECPCGARGPRRGTEEEATDAWNNIAFLSYVGAVLRSSDVNKDAYARAFAGAEEWTLTSEEIRKILFPKKEKP